MGSLAVTRPRRVCGSNLRSAFLPAPQRHPLAGPPVCAVPADVAISPQLVRVRSWLLRIVQSMELPPNPLDQLIELLGGEDNVAELTGGQRGWGAQAGLPTMPCVGNARGWQ